MTCNFEPMIEYFFVLWGVVLIVYMFFPWSKSTRMKRYVIHFAPLLCVFTYMFYEYKMLSECSQMNIRIDLLIAWPMLAIMLVLYLAKVFFLKDGNDAEKHI